MDPERLNTDHLEKRFGVAAVDKGFVTPKDVIEALRLQVMEDIECGKHRLIGRILLEMGAITEPQIDVVLKELGVNLPLLREV